MQLIHKHTKHTKQLLQCTVKSLNAISWRSNLFVKQKLNNVMMKMFYRKICFCNSNQFAKKSIKLYSKNIYEILLQKSLNNSSTMQKNTLLCLYNERKCFNLMNLKSKWLLRFRNAIEKSWNEIYSEMTKWCATNDWVECKFCSSFTSSLFTKMIKWRCFSSTEYFNEGLLQ